LALSFPLNDSFPGVGNDRSAPITALKFSNPQNNGLPLWGASNAGVTLIVRYQPRQQTGFYAPHVWYTDAGTFYNSVPTSSGGNGASGVGYWGSGSPFPLNGNSNQTNHNWEIAIDSGDYLTADAGGTIAVVKGVWYTQAMRITRTNANSKTLKFYYNLPSVSANSTMTRIMTMTNYGEVPTSNPQLTIGDSPWYFDYQHESLGGYLGETKIFNAVLSEADMLLESANMNSVVTSAGQASCWFFKPGWLSADDLTSECGAAHSFSWIDSSHKAALVALPP